MIDVGCTARETCDGETLASHGSWTSGGAWQGLREVPRPELGGIKATVP